MSVSPVKLVAAGGEVLRLEQHGDVRPSERAAVRDLEARVVDRTVAAAERGDGAVAPAGRIGSSAVSNAGSGVVVPFVISAGDVPVVVEPERVHGAAVVRLLDRREASAVELHELDVRNVDAGRRAGVRDGEAGVRGELTVTVPAKPAMALMAFVTFVLLYASSGVLPMSAESLPPMRTRNVLKYVAVPAPDGPPDRPLASVYWNVLEDGTAVMVKLPL